MTLLLLLLAILWPLSLFESSQPFLSDMPNQWVKRQKEQWPRVTQSSCPLQATSQSTILNYLIIMLSYLRFTPVSVTLFGPTETTTSFGQARAQAFASACTGAHL